MGSQSYRYSLIQKLMKDYDTFLPSVLSLTDLSSLTLICFLVEVWPLFVLPLTLVFLYQYSDWPVPLKCLYLFAPQRLGLEIQW